MKHTFPIHDGTVQIRDLDLSTDFFTAKLDADARLEGTLDGAGSVQLDETFSKGMLSGFPQTEVLANRASRIELPLIVKYSDAKLSVLPDVQKVLGNLASGGGAKALAGFLSAAGKRQAPAADGQPAKKDKLSGWLDKLSAATGKGEESAPASGS
jgi:hypothetical protein